MNFFQKALSYLPAALILLFVFLIFTYRDFNDSDTAEDPKTVFPTNFPQPGLTRTIVTSKKSDVKYWELEADTVTFDNENNKVLAKDVLCRFYDKYGSVYILFESPTADVNMDTEHIVFPELSKGMIKRSGDILEVGRLEWDGKKKKIFGFNGVKMFRSDYMLKGDEMIGDPDAKNVEILKNVSGLYFSPELNRESLLKKN